MKLLIVNLLCAMILLQGCYSYSSIESEELYLRRTLYTTDINVYLKDNNQIRSDAYHHVEVTGLSDCIVGAGSCLNPSSGHKSEFAGKLLRSSVDSSKITTRGLSCWLSDGSQITFRDGDYIDITPDSGTGFWFTGTKKKSVFMRKVPLDSVNLIEVPRMEGALTSFLISYSFLAAILIAIHVANPHFAPGYAF